MNLWTRFLVTALGLIPFLSTFALNDIPADDPHRHYFEHLSEVGIMRPNAEGFFRPGGSVTRAEALTVAMRAGQIRIPEKTEVTHFGDVDPNVWYATIVDRGVQTGVVKKGAPNFRPHDPVTKSEFLAFLLRATATYIGNHKTDRNIANDVPNESWMVPFFGYAKKYQIAHIDANNNYLPGRHLTRREVGVMTYRQLRVHHGNIETKELIRLQAAIKQFLQSVKSGNYQDAEFQVHSILKLNEKIVRTRNNQDAVAAQAISKAMKHLVESLRNFRYEKNLAGISELHLAIKQTKRAGQKSERMRPFSEELTQVINETLLSFQLDNVEMPSVAAVQP